MTRTAKRRTRLGAMVAALMLSSTGCVYYSGITSVLCGFFNDGAAIYVFEPVVPDSNPDFYWLVPGIIGVDCFNRVG